MTWPHGRTVHLLRKVLIQSPFDPLPHPVGAYYYMYDTQ